MIAFLLGGHPRKQDIDARDETGRTALHRVMGRSLRPEAVETVNQLLQKGADISIEDEVARNSPDLLSPAAEGILRAEYEKVTHDIMQQLQTGTASANSDWRQIRFAE
jgi:ankyrin repeat protein